MTVELLQTLSLVAYIVAGVLFLVAVALFFLLDVPKLYGDISGRTAKKAIEAIRKQNEATGNTSSTLGNAKTAQVKLTDKITKSGRLQSRTSGLPVNGKTEKFTKAPQHSVNETTVLQKTAGETTVLQNSTNETTLLQHSANETTLLQHPANETTLLQQAANETTLLNNANSTAGQTANLGNAPAVPSVSAVKPANFTIDVEMTFIGSTEIIE